MITFDEILPLLGELFREHGATITEIRPLLINRDLNGRVRLIVDEQWERKPEAVVALREFARQLHEILGTHSYPAEHALLFESDFAHVLAKETKFHFEGAEEVFVVDRMAVECGWTSISPIEGTIPRIVFFSIKGGVGRSTALAATAWALAEQGKKVLVLDLDLESPGLSSALLPKDRRPSYGITDWLVEDLVGNGATVLENMTAKSALSHNGEILVVPAHGAEPGEYIPKLGRVWMPKVDAEGQRDPWYRRLCRVVNELEQKWMPDVTLIDSRAGIDEVASACITELSASTILLFAIDGDQTWSGYRVLFEHWRKTGAVRKIRDRLQVVGAMVPELGAQEHLDGLLVRAWDVFSEELYDAVPAGAVATGEDMWSFDKADSSAPHFAWPIRWHRSFAALRSLHDRLERVDPSEVNSIFGPLIEGVSNSYQRDGGIV